MVSFLYSLDTDILSGAFNGFYLEILSGTCNGIIYLTLIPVFLQTSAMAWFGDDFAEGIFKAWDHTHVRSMNVHSRSDAHVQSRSVWIS